MAGWRHTVVRSSFVSHLSEAIRDGPDTHLLSLSLTLSHLPETVCSVSRLTALLCSPMRLVPRRGAVRRAALSDRLPYAAQVPPS